MTQGVDSRVCTGCHQEKSLVEFGKTRRDGLGRRCKSCRNKEGTKYYTEHREERLLYGKKWREKNSQRVIEVNKKWDKEHVKERMGAQRKWRERNPHKSREYYQKYYSDPQKRMAANLRIRLNVYKLTSNEFNTMYARQDYRCACCGIPAPPHGRKGLWIDHDHKTGKVRGLLCRNCNSMLGDARDTIQTLQAGIDYLNKHASH